MKIEKKVLIIFIILLGTIVFLIYNSYFHKIPVQTNSEEFIKKIDSLNSKIDSVYIIRDSVYERIDTVYIKLEDNNKQYEENFNHIINNDVNEDYMFFLNYINSNRDRLDNISNSF